MKSKHIFLITVLAMSLLIAFSGEINDLLFIVLLFSIMGFGTERTLKAILKGN